MANCDLDITANNTPDGTVVRLDLPAPVGKAYSSTMTGQAAQIIVPEADILLIESIQGLLTLGPNTYDILLDAPLLPAPGNIIAATTQTWTFPSKPGVKRQIRAVEDDEDETEIATSGALAETTSIELTGLPSDGRKFLIRMVEQYISGDPSSNVVTYFPYYGVTATLGDIAQLRTYREGWGKDVQIYDNVVTVDTLNYTATSGLKAALQDSTNAVVRLNPNFHGQTMEIAVAPEVHYGSGVTWDGTHADIEIKITAPFRPNGNPERYWNVFDFGNNAIIGVHLNGNDRIQQIVTMDRGQNYLLSHNTFRDATDEMVHGGGGGRFTDSGRRISVLDNDFARTNTNYDGKGCNYDADGRNGQLNGRNRGFSVGRNHFHGPIHARCPQTSGGRQAHSFNNLLDGQDSQAWMQAKHGASAAADGPEGGAMLCQANHFVEAYGGFKAAEVGKTDPMHASHPDYPSGTLDSRIWYDSSHASIYGGTYNPTATAAQNRYDFQAADPASSTGAPQKVDVDPAEAPAYYPTPYTVNDVATRVPDESGHLGSTLVRYD